MNEVREEENITIQCIQMGGYTLGPCDAKEKKEKIFNSNGEKFHYV